MRLVSLSLSWFAAGVLLALVPAALSAPTPEAAKSNAEPTATEELREKLMQSSDFTAQAEWTLGDALDYLTDRYALKINVDTRAFEAKKLAQVRGLNIAPGESWTLKGSSLRDVLGNILCHLPLDETEATCVLIGDRVIITTAEWAPYRLLRQRVSVDCRKEPLSAVLKKLARETGTNLVLDPHAVKEAETPVTLKLQDVTLERTLVVLAEANDLKPLRLGNIVLLTTKAHAAEMRADKQRAALLDSFPLPTDVKVPALP